MVKLGFQLNEQSGYRTGFNDKKKLVIIMNRNKRYDAKEEQKNSGIMIAVI